MTKDKLEARLRQIQEGKERAQLIFQQLAGQESLVKELLKEISTESVEPTKQG